MARSSLLPHGMTSDAARGGTAAGYAYAAGAVIVATVVAFTLGLRLDPVVVAPYLVAIGASAARGGFGPALAATAASLVLCCRWLLDPLLLDANDGVPWRLSVSRLAILLAAGLVLTATVGLRRRVEDELRRSHRQLLRFIVDRHVGLCEVGSDGRIAWIDEGAGALLGGSCRDLTGSPLAEVLADPALAAAILACRTEDRAIENRPARARCGDGSRRDVLVNANGSWSLRDVRDDRVVFAMVPVAGAPPQLPTVGRRVA